MVPVNKPGESPAGADRPPPMSQGSSSSSSSNAKESGQMRAPPRRVRRRSDPAPGPFVMHWKLEREKRRGMIVPVIVNAGGQLVTSPPTFHFSMGPPPPVAAASSSNQLTIQRASPPSSTESSQRASVSAKNSPLTSPRSGAPVISRDQTISPPPSLINIPASFSSSALLPGMVIPGNAATRQPATAARLAAAPYERRRSSLPDLRVPPAYPSSSIPGQPHQQHPILPPHMYPQLHNRQPPAYSTFQHQQAPSQQQHQSTQYHQQVLSNASSEIRLAPFGGGLQCTNTTNENQNQQQSSQNSLPLTAPSHQFHGQPQPLPSPQSMIFHQYHPLSPRQQQRAIRLANSVSPQPQQIPSSEPVGMKPLLEQVAHSLLIIGDEAYNRERASTTSPSSQDPSVLPHLVNSAAHHYHQPSSHCGTSPTYDRMSIGALLCSSPRSRDMESKPSPTEPESSGNSSASGSYLDETRSLKISPTNSAGSL